MRVPRELDAPSCLGHLMTYYAGHVVPSGICFPTIPGEGPLQTSSSVPLNCPPGEHPVVLSICRQSWRGLQRMYELKVLPPS